MLSSQIENEIFLIISNLGPVSLNIANNLIEKGKHVRLVVKNKSKSESFLGENLHKLESIHEHDWDNQPCDVLFGKNPILEKNVRFLYIVAGEMTSNSNQIIKLVASIIQSIKKLNIISQIERFVLITSTSVTKPFSFPCLIQNLFSNFIMYSFYQAENLIRNSGIKYLVIRPSSQHLGLKATAFVLDQGDKIKGYITPSTIANLSVDSSLDHWVFPNNTFECSSKNSQLSQYYLYIPSNYSALKPDNIQNMVDFSRYHIWSVFMTRSILTASIFLFAFFIKKKFNQRPKLENLNINITLC
jgi:hypothetical protein